jgi:hypothetical protein
VKKHCTPKNQLDKLADETCTKTKTTNKGTGKKRIPVDVLTSSVALEVLCLAVGQKSES